MPSRIFEDTPYLMHLFQNKDTLSQCSEEGFLGAEFALTYGLICVFCSI